MRYAVILLLLSGCASAPQYPVYPTPYPVYSSSHGVDGGFTGQASDAPAVSGAPCTSDYNSATPPPLGLNPCTTPQMSTYPGYGYGLPLWSAYPGYGYGYGMSMWSPYPAYAYAPPFYYGAPFYSAAYFGASYYRAPYYGPRYYSAGYAPRPATYAPRYSHSHSGGRKGRK
jgi:hypothetical protein